MIDTGYLKIKFLLQYTILAYNSFLKNNSLKCNPQFIYLHTVKVYFSHRTASMLDEYKVFAF